MNWAAVLFLLASGACAQSDTPCDGEECSSDAGDGDGDGDHEPAPVCARAEAGAFFSVALRQDSDCSETSDGEPLPIGSFDIGGACAGRSYAALLRAHSCLHSAGDDLQIHSAEIRLMNIDRATIVFDRTSPPLPNPFLVATNGGVPRMTGAEPATGVIGLDVIPSSYREQLDVFEGEQLLAEIQAFGATSGGVDVDLSSFLFVIDVCEDCMEGCGARTCN